MNINYIHQLNDNFDRIREINTLNSFDSTAWNISDFKSDVKNFRRRFRSSFIRTKEWLKKNYPELML